MRVLGAGCYNSPVAGGAGDSIGAGGRGESGPLNTVGAGVRGSWAGWVGAGGERVAGSRQQAREAGAVGMQPAGPTAICAWHSGVLPLVHPPPSSDPKAHETIALVRTSATHLSVLQHDRIAVRHDGAGRHNQKLRVEGGQGGRGGRVVMPGVIGAAAALRAPGQRAHSTGGSVPGPQQGSHTS